MEVQGHYIAGRWEATSGRDVIEVDSPTDGSLVGAVVAGTPADVDRAVAAAVEAFEGWAVTPLEERIRLVRVLVTGLEAHREELARTLSAEMGAPLDFARGAQVGVAIKDLEALVAAAGELRPRRAVSGSLVVTEPAGVVAAITPWNFPLHQIMLKLGAAVLAGCTFVLKPSEVAPLNAAIVARLVHEAGFPAGVVNVVHGNGAQVGAPLTAHPGVDVVTFTGSREVGAVVARAASESIKRVSLELGGKSAAILLPDAPLEESVAAVLGSCFANTGQTCAALTRALVPRQLHDEFELAATRLAASWTPGDPLAGARLGPLTSMAQRQKVAGFVDRAVNDGAEVAFGGRAPDGFDGAFYEPTLLTHVTPDMEIFREEVFGPVLVLVPYDSVDEAVALANDSRYGLSGAVFSAHEDAALEVALRLRTGSVGLNGAGLDVGAPFGGYKESGVGREAGAWGLEEFLEFKTVMGAAHLA
jgi:aldehyde dehydrogenase (NAD+)